MSNTEPLDPARRAAENPADTPVHELRVDPLSGLKTIIAGERVERPGGGFSVSEPPAIDESSDPFLEGHEDRTPPELFALRPDGSAPNGPGWLVRVVPNLYPALRPDAVEPSAHANPDLFTAQPARGAHEVIINSPRAFSSLGDLSVEEVTVAMSVWRERMRAHADARYVHLIVNEQPEAGASLPHTHAQLYALEFVPAAIARERERFGAYAARTMGGNLLGDLLQEEVRLKQRVVAIDDEAVVLAPYASRLPFQLMLVPRQPTQHFTSDGPTGAHLLHDVIGRLRTYLGGLPPLNLWVRTAPAGADHFCWRIDIMPRLTRLAGLELGTGVHLCAVAPEHVARALR